MGKILSNVPTISRLASGDKYENNIFVAKNEAANWSKSEK